MDELSGRINEKKQELDQIRAEMKDREEIQALYDQKKEINSRIREKNAEIKKIRDVYFE